MLIIICVFYESINQRTDNHDLEVTWSIDGSSTIRRVTFDQGEYPNPFAIIDKPRVGFLAFSFTQWLKRKAAASILDSSAYFQDPPSHNLQVFGKWKNKTLNHRGRSCKNNRRQAIRIFGFSSTYNDHQIAE